MSVITLLTDFGYQDAYVGVMKGVIAQLCPTAPLIDLTHAVPPQDLWAARFQLQIAYPYFPAGTVHLAVVDPGVGGRRRAVALQLPHAYLVGPDNGIFSGILAAQLPVAAVVLDRPQLWRTPCPSHTFHGRDIFAAVAARLACGCALSELGSPIDPQGIVALELPAPQRFPQRLLGVIQHVDGFGNLITTVPGDWVADARWQAFYGSRSIPSVRSYGDVEETTPAACIGSHGWIEIALNGGSAQTYLGAQRGDPVEVRLGPQQFE